MAYAMVPIYTQTIGSGGVSSITFNNIPSNYTDLKVVFSARNGSGASRWGMYYRFNGDTSSLYSYTCVNGYDSSSYQLARASNSSSLGEQAIPAGSATANTFSLNELYIPNYSASVFKQLLSEHISENNSTSAWMIGFAGALWRNTAAINSITITPNDGSWLQYSTFTLYGIKNA